MQNGFSEDQWKKMTLIVKKRIKKMFLYLLSTFQNDDTNASWLLHSKSKALSKSGE